MDEQPTTGWYVLKPPVLLLRRRASGRTQVGACNLVLCHG